MRQPGSSFKLFVYLAALEAGYKPDDIVPDEPITINGWSPRNNSRSFAGDVTLREAFARSINTVSVRLAQEVGFRTVADMAQRFGITTPVNTHPSMALGSSDVRLIDMTRAYAVGRRARASRSSPTASAGSPPPSGELLYQHEADESRVLVAPWVAAQMTDLLQAAVLTGTGARRADRPAGRRQDRNDQLEQGRLVPRLLERPHHRRLDGPRRRQARSRACRAAGRRRAPSTISWRAAVANRPVENFEIEVDAARLAGGAGRGNLVRRARQWS